MSTPETKELSPNETNQENKAIALVIHEMMKHFNLLPVEYSATTNLYVMFPGATCEVASVLGGQDCKWFSIIFGKTPSSIRICSSQDYSIILRQLEFRVEDMKKMNKIETEEDIKEYKACSAIWAFANKHLRPAMVQHGLVGSHSYWKSEMKSPVVEQQMNQDEPDSSVWFKQEQSIWVFAQPDLLFLLSQYESFGMKQLMNASGVVISAWSIQMGFSKHPEFASLERC